MRNIDNIQYRVTIQGVRQQISIHIVDTVLVVLQEVDFAIGDFTITKSRSSVVDFMTSFYGETKTFIIRVPKEDTTMIYTRVFKVSRDLPFQIT